MQNERVKRSIADKAEPAEISRVIPERTPLNQLSPLHSQPPLIVAATYFGNLLGPGPNPFIGQIA
jgi:hypothetical protein